MRIILLENEYNAIWNEIERRFNYPNIKNNNFISDLPYKTYKIPFWNNNQEKLVNQIFIESGNNDLYALDWQHDCFVYNPNENIPTNKNWKDTERNCNVYFPTYYPNGDYFAFTSKDFAFGLFGNPWRQEIYVVGEALIKLFEQYKIELGLSEI